MRRNTQPNPQRPPRQSPRRAARRSPRRHSGSTRILDTVSGFRGHFPKPADGEQLGTTRSHPRRRPTDLLPRPSPCRRPLPPPVRTPPALPPRSRFRPSASLPPAPHGGLTRYGPSCFFPARAVGVVLAPAVTAVLTLLSPAPASAAAAPSSAATAERGVEGASDRPAGAARAEGLGHPEGRTPAQGVTRGEAVTRLRLATRPGGAAHRGVTARGGITARGGVTASPGVGASPEVEARPDAVGVDRAWPVAGPAGIGPTVVRGWEPPPSPWAAGHRGVDLVAPTGALVRAAAPGRVVYAGTVAGRGVLTIEVFRSGRPPLRTTYEPVRPTARKGQRVTAGQPVAVLQRGPFHCRAPCLHWGLRRGKSYLDPLSLLPRSMLRGGPSRLLPIFGVPVPAAGRTVPPHSGPSEPPNSAVSTKPAAQVGRSAPTGTALLAAAGLAAAALWALGRLHRARPPGTEEDAQRRRDGQWHGLRRGGG
ncbi:murein hydrolase activator EnvC family protein [Streptomyces sp. NPDC048434]|uniref:murein hydrolase activator EnvC family protein n=1 Tax=Streptomyces sp. NPDC048434 TaxID=3365549 RepID=UPI003710B27B